jgi:hypothetical protein
VYCIGCKKKAVGRDPVRIKQHAKDCTVRFLDHIHCVHSQLNIYILGLVERFHQAVF